MQKRYKRQYSSKNRLPLGLVVWFTVHVATLQAAVHPLPADEYALMGQIDFHFTREEDTFAKIARKYAVGYDALLRLNPDVDEWLPGDGHRLVIPRQMLMPDAKREGIVVNLSELRLYLFEPDQQQVRVYPIGIGSEGRATPLMSTRVTTKIANPTWYPPDSVRARHAKNGKQLARQIPPGPDNPLGAFAIGLARKGYFIHGTNNPIGVGRRVSAGCIRMYEPHIAELVAQVNRGVPVRVIRQPYKVGWHDGGLYLEAHPRPMPAEDGEGESVAQSVSHSGFVAQIIKATEKKPAEIDWALAFATAEEAQGLPVRISR